MDSCQRTTLGRAELERLHSPSQAVFVFAER